jgi:hypothetical protein
MKPRIDPGMLLIRKAIMKASMERVTVDKLRLKTIGETNKALITAPNVVPIGSVRAA